MVTNPPPPQPGWQSMPPGQNPDGPPVPYWQPGAVPPASAGQPMPPQAPYPGAPHQQQPQYPPQYQQPTHQPHQPPPGASPWGRETVSAPPPYGDPAAPPGYLFDREPRTGPPVVRRKRWPFVVAGLGVLVAAVVAFGFLSGLFIIRQLDQAATVRQVTEELTRRGHKDVSNVSCDLSTEEIAAGARYSCTARLDGREAKLTLTITDAAAARYEIAVA